LRAAEYEECAKEKSISSNTHIHSVPPIFYYMVFT